MEDTEPMRRGYTRKYALSLALGLLLVMAGASSVPAAAANEWDDIKPWPRWAIGR